LIAISGATQPIITKQIISLLFRSHIYNKCKSVCYFGSQGSTYFNY